MNPRPASDGPIEPLLFSTRALSPRDQFDAWRSFMAPAITLDVDGMRQAPFGADQTVWDVGSFALTRAAMPNDGRVRNWTHLRKNALDHWCFVVVDDDASTSRGLFFRSLGERFEGTASDTGVLSLYLPRELFDDGLSRIDGTTAVPDQGIGALLADYFVSLERRLPEIPRSELPQVVEATRAMIAACVQPSRDRLDMAQGAIVATLMERARVVVRQNFGAPGFGPDQLAHALGVSRSRLYRLFEPHGGVARYVHRQRMLAAHAALSDAADARSIGRIAEAFGFGDASGFSRGFKQQFGYSPSEARVAGLARAPARTLPQRRHSSETAEFAAILQRLAA
ncbi:helix-turn-helix domain-containing protein [Kaistia adipata]|uniref:helix-turn-helix domain-containing protein n=1 Tax=Kaistia adipata TaxID=166954 RepID=UPI001AEC2DD8|nr:helix-turn-helix domain-containing protein [Kaistia adipata]